MPSATRRSSGTSPSRRCSTGCSASSRRCSRCASARPGPGLARQRALLPHRARRPRCWSASSTSTRTRAPASAPAPGWTTCAAAGAAPTAPLQTPVAHLVCNFAPPVADGHAGAADARRRDHAVPRVRPRPAPHADAASTSSACPASPASSGTRSSCRASSWRTSAGSGRCCAPDARTSTRGAPLPRALFDKMIAAKNFHSGLETLRQVEFALFDMRLHAEPDAAQRASSRCSTKCAPRCRC